MFYVNMKLGRGFYGVVRCSKRRVDWFRCKDDNLNMPNTFMHLKKCAQVSPLYPTIAFVPMRQLDDVACYLGYAAHFPSALGKLQYTERSFFSLNSEMDCNFFVFQTSCKGICLPYLFEGPLRTIQTRVCC